MCAYTRPDQLSMRGRAQSSPATNMYLLEGGLAGGPNNGPVQQGVSTFDQGSCECAHLLQITGHCKILAHQGQSEP